MAGWLAASTGWTLDFVKNNSSYSSSSPSSTSMLFYPLTLVVLKWSWLDWNNFLINFDDKMLFYPFLPTNNYHQTLPATIHSSISTLFSHLFCFQRVSIHHTGLISVYFNIYLFISFNSFWLPLLYHFSRKVKLGSTIWRMTID